MANCTVCSQSGLRKLVDGYLEDGMSGAGVHRALSEIGVDLSADVINRHKQHYAPPPERPKGTAKRDFAILVRDKAMEQFEGEELDLRDKDHAPGINAGLKAQALIDGREKVKSKQQNAELAFAIIAMLQGGAPEPKQITDGLTIEGEYTEVPVVEG